MRMLGHTHQEVFSGLTTAQNGVKRLAQRNLRLRYRRRGRLPIPRGLISDCDLKDRDEDQEHIEQEVVFGKLGEEQIMLPLLVLNDSNLFYKSECDRADTR